MPAYGTFWALRGRSKMRWTNSHLHAFTVPEGCAGVVDSGFPDPDGELEFKSGWRRQLKRQVRSVGQDFVYVYDFGDDWQHVVVLEGILMAEPGMRYPRCLAGARRCPSADCGGASSRKIDDRQGGGRGDARTERIVSYPEAVGHRLSSQT